MKISAQLTGDKAVRAELQRIGGLSTKALAATAVQVEDYIEAEAAASTPRPAPLFSRSSKGHCRAAGGNWATTCSALPRRCGCTGAPAPT